MAQRIKCEVCGNSYYDSVAVECPMKLGHFICMYCCMRKCKRNYLWNGMQRCKARDEAIAKKKEQEKNEKKKQGGDLG